MKQRHVIHVSEWSVNLRKLLWQSCASCWIEVDLVLLLAPVESGTTSFNKRILITSPTVFATVVSQYVLVITMQHMLCVGKDEEHVLYGTSGQK